MKQLSIFSFLFLLYSCSPKVSFDTDTLSNTSYTDLSVEFLEALRLNKKTDSIKLEIKNLDIDKLASELINDQLRLAFWVNIYNGFIQDVLKDKPELYENRGDFFRKPRIEIGGLKLSFGDIEHGIIRRSQNEFGLGYIRKWFPPKWERKLRVRHRDFRIHFALNCGAKDCPPVAIYKPELINSQLDKSTELYLKGNTTVEGSNIEVTSLFSWFRGDFGGKRGVKKILNEYTEIRGISNKKLKYRSYDWSLLLDNYIDL